MTQHSPLEERGWPDSAVRELILRAQNGEKEARDRLVEANLRLVHSLVARFASSTADQEDLFQIGCIGLMKAIDRFDLSYDVRFSTYAVPSIMGEIRRYLRDDGTIHVSRGLKQLAVKVNRVRERLAGELGRHPTTSDIANELCVSIEEVVEAIECCRSPSSIHQVIHVGDGDPIFLLDQLASDACHKEGQWIDRVAVREGLAKLEPREQSVILLRFFRDKTQTEVADILGCSQVQVSRIERRAIERMRHHVSTG